jgi:radical SAM superfamily enzyme with C-terminal helix-hairpin-helix motif
MIGYDDYYSGNLSSEKKFVDVDIVTLENLDGTILQKFLVHRDWLFHVAVPEPPGKYIVGRRAWTRKGNE